MKLFLLLLFFFVVCAASAQITLLTEAEKQLKTGIQSGEIPSGLKILVVKRKWPEQPGGKSKLYALGFPSNHECQSALDKNIYENKIGIFHSQSGEYKILYKPEKSYFVGQIKLHWNANKFLFTQSDSINWKIYELNIDGTGLRQVSQTPDDVDCFESCYLPDGRIIFASNAPMLCVPCWHGFETKETIVNP